MNFTVGGSVSDALTHLAMVGTAAILQESGCAVQMGWADGAAATARIWLPDGVDVGTCVQTHAARHSSDDSWVQHKHEHLGAMVGSFSPRIKAAVSRSTWETLIRVRTDGLSSGSLTWLDHAMIGALGEPAYWLADQPDLGASRWEMKTRNRGEEFVGHRLGPLARQVAARTPAHITAGLVGGVVDDGKNGASSRTATGLRSPGPTDTAVAWCALWGISQTTLVPQARAMSQTSGSSPRNRVHPRAMALPVFARPVTLGRWRGVMASHQLDEVAFGQKAASSHAWLKMAGVTALVVFPTEVVGSKSAPERRLLQGSLKLL